MLKKKGRKAGKRFIVCLLLGMLLSLTMAMTVFAEEDGYVDENGIRHYEVFVNGVEVTDKNQDDVLGNGKVRFSNRRLFLDNVTLTKGYETSNGFAAIYSTKSLFIYCDGENLIDMSAYNGGTKIVYGVYCKETVEFSTIYQNRTNKIDFRFAKNGSARVAGVYAKDINWMQYDANFYFAEGSNSYAMNLFSTSVNGYVSNYKSTFHFYNLRFLPSFENTNNPMTYYVKGGDVYSRTEAENIVLPMKEGYVKKLFWGGDLYLYLKNNLSLDLDKDGYLSIEECEKVEKLSIVSQSNDVSESFVDFDGLSNFPNLKDLTIQRSGYADVLELSELKKLESLSLSAVMAETIDISQNTKLKSVNFSNVTANELKSGTYPELTSIKMSMLRGDFDTNFDFSTSVNLKELSISGAKGIVKTGNLSRLEMLEFTSRSESEGKIIIGTCPNLSTIRITNAKDSSYDFSKNQKLETLYLKDNSMLEYVTVYSGQQLRKLSILNSPKLKSVNYQNASGLKELELVGDNLSVIDLSKLTQLEVLNVGENNLTELNVDNCEKLIEIYCYDNKLQTLNVSNVGAYSSEQLKFMDVGNQKNNLLLTVYVQSERREAIKAVIDKIQGFHTGNVYVADSPVTITKQPLDASPKEGSQAKFSVSTKETGLSYQWQWRRNDASEWANTAFTGSKTATMTVDAISARNGFQYRCKIVDKNGIAVFSNYAVLRISAGEALAITKQPENQTAKTGTVKFSVVAAGDGLTYQWQWRKNVSSAWGAAGFTGAKTAEMTVEAISARNGFQYRCEIKDKSGKVIYTNPATLYFAEKVKITKQPEDRAAGSGNVKFTITAAGDGLTYQWQWRRNASSAWGAAGFTGAKTATMTVEAISARNGFQYRCEVKDKYGNAVYSEPATLYVSSTAIIVKNPVNQTLKTGNAVFSVLAAGDGLTYQWYWRKNSSSAWGVAGFTGARTASMQVEAIAARNGFQYRCEVKDKYGIKVVSEPATLYFGSMATITKQPVSVKTTAGKTAAFSLAATGDGLTYQWYWRKNASSDWGVCGFTGAKTASMQVEAIAARNGFQYQCVVKDKYGNAVSSQIVTLTVQ